MRDRFRFAAAMAAFIAGTLDILPAFAFAGIGGVTPLQVLKFVASGPFGGAVRHGDAWAAVGLLVHFAIMATMGVAYMILAQRFPALLRRPVLAGLGYGVLLWLLIYWAVMPLRWPETPLPHSLYEIATALFSHCILVGLPIALIAARAFKTVPYGA